jgi:hypothetical protein
MDAREKCDVGAGLVKKTRDWNDGQRSSNNSKEFQASHSKIYLETTSFITRISFMKIDQIVPKIRDGTL